ncbi:MAG: hypothetical protein WEA31_06450 [Pirellulales bacterium]
MSKRFTVCALAALLVACTAIESHAVTLTPSSAGLGWTRGDADTTYMEWDEFAGGEANPPDPDQVPDIGSFGTGAEFATVNVTSAANPGIITSTDNIYSSGDPIEFTVDFPVESDNFTRVMVQIRTLGTDLDTDSLLIGTTAPSYIEEISRVTSGSPFGGSSVDTVAVWDFSGPISMLSLDFGSLIAPAPFPPNGPSSFMSLDKLVIDTGSQTTAFAALDTPFVASVPEPNAAILAVIGMLGFLGLVFYRKSRVKRLS